MFVLWKLKTMQRDSSLCSSKSMVANDEVNNISLMLFWKIACGVPEFTQ